MEEEMKALAEKRKQEKRMKADALKQMAAVRTVLTK